MKIALVALLLSPHPVFAATQPATQMSCDGISWSTHCKSDDLCDPPPPLPMQHFGTVNLQREDGSGWVAGKGEFDRSFTLSGQALDFTAVGQYSMNKDGSVYEPGIELTFRSRSTGLTVSTNGPVSGTSARLTASVDSPRAADGSHTHDYAVVFCNLN